MAWEITEAIGYYKKQGAPADQTALVALLKEVQQENTGSIPAYLLSRIARELGVKESYLLALIRRIPSLRLADTHCLELCCGPNCGKRAALSEFVKVTYGADPTGFTVKYGPCMRMCGKGPNIKWDGQLYHRADEALIRRLVDGIRKEG